MHSGTRHRTRQGSAVTTVVTFATEDQGAFAGRVVVESPPEGVETRSAGGFHQEQGIGVIVLNSQAVDLADLLSGEYGLHVWMIGRRWRTVKYRLRPQISQITQIYLRNLWMDF